MKSHSMLQWERNARRREKKQRDSREMAIARPIVLERSGGHCEAQVSGQCTRVGSELHHVRMRSQGGNNDPLNLLWVCLFCHRHIHDHPADSYRQGFLKRTTWED